VNQVSPGARAVSALEISDVFLVESSCHVRRDFNPTEHFDKVTFQHRLLPEKEGVAQVRTDALTGDEITIMRYFIDGGLRVLRPEFSRGATADAEPTSEDVLAEISVRLAVDYVCPKALLEDRDAIGSFSKNAVFHSWSYWRSLIHSFSDQMRLPRITLPMLRQHNLGPMQPLAASPNTDAGAPPGIRIENPRNDRRQLPKIGEHSGALRKKKTRLVKAKTHRKK
jgi:hypothetical protein